MNKELCMKLWSLMEIWKSKHNTYLKKHSSVLEKESQILLLLSSWLMKSAFCSSKTQLLTCSKNLVTAIMNVLIALHIYRSHHTLSQPGQSLSPCSLTMGNLTLFQQGRRKETGKQPLLKNSSTMRYKRSPPTLLLSEYLLRDCRIVFFEIE